MSKSLKEFREKRERMNKKILSCGNLEIERFFALDRKVYEDGTLSSKVKELLGLVASLVLQCEDCITYHVIRCKEENVTNEEFYEALSVALIVGGSITIPHIRQVFKLLEELS